MKFKNTFFILFSLATFCATDVSAQGFTKLKDKYGSPSTTTVPVKSSVTSSQGSSSSSGNSNTAFSGLDEEEGIVLQGEYDIKELIKAISELTQKGFIVDEKLRGKISFVSKERMSPEMAYQAFLSALEVNGYTITETPSGLINVVPQKDSHGKPLDLISGKAPNTDKFVTVIVSLKSISANEVTQVIKGLGMKSKNGQVYAYPTTNSVIITDAGSNIERITKLVNELDQQGPQQVIEIVPIINADAKDIAEKINQLFADSSSSQTQTTRRVRRRRIRGNTTQEMQEVPSISKVIADERTNSVILMGRKRDLAKVKATISRLDRSIAGVEGSIHVYYLKHATAKDVAQTLNNLVADSKSSSSSSTNSRTNRTNSRTSARNSAAANTGSVTLEGGVKVTADEGTNSLVIVASPKDYMILVDQVIAKLDIVRPQVYLEAIIMSLDVSKSLNLGVNLMGGLTNLADKGLNLFGSVLPTATQSLTTIAGLSGGFAGGVVSDRTIDFTLSDGSTISVPAVSGIIQAIAADTNTNVLSTPSVLTLDNEEAQIQVGQEVPVPSGTTLSTGGVTTFDVTREDTGIILKIKPQISDEGNTVRLKITQEITTVIAADPNLGPTLDKKSVDTTVLAKDKQTIVIGGLLDDQDSVTNTKVPLLGDIPVLGNLFKTKTRTQQKRNLVIFITPYIIRDREDYLVVSKKKIEERKAFVDANYGYSQRKRIRKSIKRHAADLLEFSCAFPDPGSPCQYQKHPPTSALITDKDDNDKTSKKSKRRSRKHSTR